MSRTKPPITVLITGAGRGIGRGTALALADAGCRLGLIDRDLANLEQVQAELTARRVAVAIAPADVTDRAALNEGVRRLEAEVGPTDVLIACAGIGGLTPLPPDLEIDGFRAMLEVNVVGMARSIEAVLPGMIARGKGHIVGVSSVTAYPRVALDGRLLDVKGGGLGDARRVAARAPPPGGDDHHRVSRHGPDRDDRRHSLSQADPDDGAGTGGPTHRPRCAPSPAELRLSALDRAGDDVPQARSPTAFSTG